MMYGTIASVALLGLSAVAHARPAATVPLSDIVHSEVAGTSTGSATSAATTAATTSLEVAGASTGTMTSFATLTGASAQAPSGTASAGLMGSNGALKLPLSNGFPNIGNPSSQLDQINIDAHGELSNKGAPTGLQPDTVNALAFVAFNELFEVDFFATLLDKVQKSEPGFQSRDLLGLDQDTVIATLKVILAQEELHELNANGIVKANIGKTLEPCTYKFPPTKFEDAIATASLFTDVVLGTLPDVQSIAATDKDIGVVGAVGSALGNEGEQNGFYRTILGKVPSQLPFLTGAARNFAFNAILQNFVISCPASTLALLETPASGIPLNETGILNVLTKNLDITEDVIADFSVQTAVASKTKSYYENNKERMLYVTYVNQQNKPVSVKIDPATIKFSADAIDFKASFPGKTDFLNGLTIAAVTETGDFASADDVASATIFGPGLIDIN